ncbi:unnamed protein product [Vitrella brassicaformis CCMP3155]|uniref:Uncharacterized protein n=1 Tax=Vitrella brassicaformis (strain CCMP3155) TaxID=1169540 RepID=A0A0G4EW40_VITBC|nr:unnamed protein product [Vitrella brassicaformis CCMP3155]|eukprot:CEM02667.1 unnamed protein product [Vitrella brassicaformis CCMP3155]
MRPGVYRTLRSIRTENAIVKAAGDGMRPLQSLLRDMLTAHPTLLPSSTYRSTPAAWDDDKAPLALDPTCCITALWHLAHDDGCSSSIEDSTQMSPYEAAPHSSDRPLPDLSLVLQLVEALVNYHHSRSAVANDGHAAASRVVRWTPEELVSAAWAAATLLHRYHQPRRGNHAAVRQLREACARLYDVVLVHAAGQLHNFRPIELARLLWTLTRVRDPGSVTIEISQGWSSGDEPPRRGRRLRAVLEEAASVMTATLSQSTPYSCSTMLWALVRLWPNKTTLQASPLSPDDPIDHTSTIPTPTHSADGRAGAHLQPVYSAPIRGLFRKTVEMLLAPLSDGDEIAAVDSFPARDFALLLWSCTHSGLFRDNGGLSRQLSSAVLRFFKAQQTYAPPEGVRSGDSATLPEDITGEAMKLHEGRSGDGSFPLTWRRHRTPMGANPQDVALICWAVADMGLLADTKQTDQLVAWLWPYVWRYSNIQPDGLNPNSTTHTDSPTFASLAFPKVTNRPSPARLFRPIELTSVAWSLVKLGIRRPAIHHAISHRLLQYLRSHVEAMRVRGRDAVAALPRGVTPGSLAMLPWSLARAGLVQGRMAPLVTEVMEVAIVEAFATNFTGFSAHEVSILSYAVSMANLDDRVKRAFFEEVSDHFAPTIGSWHPHHQALLSYALHKSAICDPPIVMAMATALKSAANTPGGLSRYHPDVLFSLMVGLLSCDSQVDALRGFRRPRGVLLDVAAYVAGWVRQRGHGQRVKGLSLATLLDLWAENRLPGTLDIASAIVEDTHVLGRFSPLSLCIVLSSLAKTGVGVSDGYLARAADMMAASIHELIQTLPNTSSEPSVDTTAETPAPLADEWLPFLALPDSSQHVQCHPHPTAGISDEASPLTVRGLVMGLWGLAVLSTRLVGHTQDQDGGESAGAASSLVGQAVDAAVELFDDTNVLERIRGDVLLLPAAAEAFAIVGQYGHRLDEQPRYRRVVRTLACFAVPMLTEGSVGEADLARLVNAVECLHECKTIDRSGPVDQ